MGVQKSIQDAHDDCSRFPSADYHLSHGWMATADLNVHLPSQQIHAGVPPPSPGNFNSVTTPIYASAAFSFDSTEYVEEVCTNQRKVSVLGARQRGESGLTVQIPCM